jgi:hypothetical protein
LWQALRSNDFGTAAVAVICFEMASIPLMSASGPQPEVRGRAANFTKNVRRNDTAFDGNRCNPRGSIGLAATGANAILQPDLSVYKTAGASLDTLVLDKVDIWANR